MKFNKSYIFCSEKLISQLDEVKEIFKVISRIDWCPGELEAVSGKNKTIYHQEAYNRLFEIEFARIGGWDPQPVLLHDPKLKGDFIKNQVFVEIQFGNSATLFRDYYKFHMGLVKKLLSLAVLITPTNPSLFFPKRNKNSIGNMANYDYALKHFMELTIPVPILLIGLLPEN